MILYKYTNTKPREKRIRIPVSKNRYLFQIIVKSKAIHQKRGAGTAE